MNRLEIYLPSGPLLPVGLGRFSEQFRRELLPMITAIYDDQKVVEIVETGSFDSETPLTFRKKLYKLEPIFDYGLFESSPASVNDIKRAQELAIGHFTAHSTKKILKGLPVSITKDEPSMETVEDAAYLYMRENGADGNLVFVDGSTTVVANADDFKLYLVDVFDNARKQKLLYGVVVCHMPSRAIRIEHKSPIRLSGVR